jgi:hypothetical protein
VETLDAVEAVAAVVVEIKRTKMKRKITHNSTYPKGGVSCSKYRFLVNETFVLLINICGESPALRVAATR